MIYVAGQGAADGSERGAVTIFDRTTLQEVGRSEPIDELLYLVADPSGRYLYAASGVAAGRIHAWRVAGENLVSLGAPVPSGGTEPCHLVVHEDGYLLVANYGSGEAGSIASLLITAEGSVGAATVLRRNSPPGPDPDRQRESHIHQVVAGRHGEVLAVDLGADQVISFRLEYGGLVDPVASQVPKGTGPRHLVLLPTGDIALSGEISSTFLRARANGREFIDWSSSPSTGRTAPPGVVNYPSDLRPSPDPDLLYLANRGVDSVAALSISSGAVVAEGVCGASPRQLAVDGALVFVAATNADQVDVLDATTLLPARPPLRVARPMCVVIDSPVAGVPG